MDGYGLVRFDYTSVSTLTGSFDGSRLLLNVDEDFLCINCCVGGGLNVL